MRIGYMIRKKVCRCAAHIFVAMRIFYSRNVIVRGSTEINSQILQKPYIMNKNLADSVEILQILQAMTHNFRLTTKSPNIILVNG